MKKEIHPKNTECKVTCACGTSFTIFSNKENMTIDICNSCHPFYTGDSKLVDAAGRVDKFNKKYKLS